MSRRRYIKAAVSIEEYFEICQHADAEGLTLAGYLRTAVARDAERQSTAQTLAAIRAALPSGQPAAPAKDDPVQQELLQLVRLLASRVDPQAAARITAAIKNQSASERKNP